MTLRQRLMPSATGLLGRLPPRLFWDRQELFVPLYHMVSDEPPVHVRAIYDSHTVRSFETQLDQLLRHFTPVALADVAASRRGELVLPPRAMLVTFDDALREVAEHAAPVLARKGVPAVMFVTTGFLDNRGLMYSHEIAVILDRLGRGLMPALQATLSRALGCPDAPAAIAAAVRAVTYPERHRLGELAGLLELDFADYARRARPYSTVAELRELAARGFTMGGHSVDHPKYRTLTFAEQVQQTTTCMAVVTEHFAPATKAFAFPFGDLDVTERFFADMHASGTFELSFGTANLRDDIDGHFQRVSMDRRRGPADQHLSRVYSERWLRRLAGRNRLQRATGA